MSSNCYVIYDDTKNHCIIIDPASELSESEIAMIQKKQLCLDYIILTHEHTDHTWGVNALLDKYPTVKVLTSEACKEELPKALQSYFMYYYDNPNYSYYVRRVDVTAEQIGNNLIWGDEKFEFIHTPGHSRGSMCVKVGDKLFSGDTLMQTKPFLNKRDSNKGDYQRSIMKLLSLVNPETQVYPGHGEMFLLKDYVLSKD